MANMDERNNYSNQKLLQCTYGHVHIMVNGSFYRKFQSLILLSSVYLKTHPEELGARLVDGYYDDTVPPGQLCQ